MCKDIHKICEPSWGYIDIDVNYECKNKSLQKYISLSSLLMFSTCYFIVSVICISLQCQLPRSLWPFAHDHHHWFIFILNKQSNLCIFLWGNRCLRIFCAGVYSLTFPFWSPLLYVMTPSNVRSIISIPSVYSQIRIDEFVNTTVCVALASVTH